jgi:hypothetical protein
MKGKMYKAGDIVRCVHKDFINPEYKNQGHPRCIEIGRKYKVVSDAKDDGYPHGPLMRVEAMDGTRFIGTYSTIHFSYAKPTNRERIKERESKSV